MEVKHSGYHELAYAENDKKSEADTNSESRKCEVNAFNDANAIAAERQTVNIKSQTGTLNAADQEQIVGTGTSQKTMDGCEIPVDVSSLKDQNITHLSEYKNTECQNSLVSIIHLLEASNSELKQTVSALVDRCDGLERTVSALTTKCGALEKTLEEVECTNRTVEREVTMWTSENDRTKRMLLQIASTLSTPTEAEATDTTEKQQPVIAKSPDELDLTKTELQKLGQEVTEIASLIKDVNGKVSWLESEFQKFMRRHSLIIENLCPKEDKSATEMFLVFVNSVLNVAIEDGEIDSIHVISQQGSSASPEKRPRPILVTFSCYGTRSRVYKAWLGFRSSKKQGSAGALSGERGSGICIREYLTELQDSLYHEAIQVREKHLIADCWTFKGKTYIRTLEGDVTEFSKEQWLSKIENSSNCVVM